MEFNLIREPGIVTVLENSADTDDLFLKLSLLSHVLESRNYNLNQAVVFSNSNVESCGKTAYLPIYMLMLLKEECLEFTDISMDSFRF